MSGVRLILGSKLVLLDMSKTACFGMDVLYLTRRLGVEVDNLLASFGACSLLVE